MDKLLKLFKTEKKNPEPTKKEIDIPNNLSETVPLKTSTEPETPKNEILFLNTSPVDNLKKHEGFYYKKYINEITKLKLVISYNIVKPYNC
jgi:hypothetical protein